MSVLRSLESKIAGLVEGTFSRAFRSEVRPRGGSWVLTDLGSTNGSRLNGRRIEGPEVIRPGDEIELGATNLRFELE